MAKVVINCIYFNKKDNKCDCSENTNLLGGRKVCKVWLDSSKECKFQKKHIKPDVDPCPQRQDDYGDLEQYRFTRRDYRDFLNEVNL